MNWLCPCLKKGRVIKRNNNDDDDEGNYDHHDDIGKIKSSMTAPVTEEPSIRQQDGQLCGNNTSTTSIYNDNVAIRDGCFSLSSNHYHSSVIRDEKNGFVINPSSSQQQNDYEKDNEDGNLDKDDSNDDHIVVHTIANDSKVFLRNSRTQCDDNILHWRSSSSSSIDYDDFAVDDKNESDNTTTVDRSIKATVSNSPYNSDSPYSSEASTINIYERQEMATTMMVERREKTIDSVHKEQPDISAEWEKTKNQEDHPRAVVESFTPKNKKPQLLLSPGSKIKNANDRTSTEQAELRLRKIEADVSKRCLARLAKNYRPLSELPTVTEQNSFCISENNNPQNNIKNETPARNLGPRENALFSYSEDSEEFTKVTIESRHNEYLRSAISAAACNTHLISDSDDIKDSSDMMDKKMMMIKGQHAGAQQLPWLPHEMHEDDGGDSLFYARLSSSWQEFYQQQSVMSQDETSDDCYNSISSSGGGGSGTITRGGSYERTTTSSTTTRESKKFLETRSFLENWLGREEQQGEEVVMRR